MAIDFDKIFIKSWRPYFWLALAGLLLYSQTLFFDLTYLDDNIWIKDYGWYLKNTVHIKELFLQPDLVSKVFFRPFLNFSFMMDARVFGKALPGYHLTNIAYHIIASMLVFTLFCRLGYQRAGSFLFALIFCVHPALASAVAWIPGRTDSLLGIFVLSSFLFFLRTLTNRNPLYLVAHLFFLLCALLTKETAVVLPVICGLFYFTYHREEGRGLKKKGLYLFLWLLVVGFWLWWRGHVITSDHKVPFIVMVQTIGQNAPVLINYLGKACFPFRLSVLPILKDLSWVEGSVAIIGLSLWIFFNKSKRGPVVLFALSWFVLFLAPALIISFLQHEYRLYLPLVGLLILILELSKGCVDHLKILKGFSAGIVILFACLTWVNSHHFKDRFAFWENAVATSPHAPLAHRNLGAMYHLEGKIALAKEAYKKAIALNPHEAMVHNNLGIIAAGEGDGKRAEEEYLKEILINPDYDNVHFNLGVLYYSQGKFLAAEALWQRSIELNPNNIEAYKKLISYYLTQKDFKRAEYYRRILVQKGVELPARMRQILEENRKKSE